MSELIIEKKNVLLNLFIYSETQNKKIMNINNTDIKKKKLTFLALNKNFWIKPHISQ